MPISLSKVMRGSDFEELKQELVTVDRVLEILDGGDKAQHPLRKWEYALALKAYRVWADQLSVITTTGDFGAVKVSDVGCCTGMLAPMMYWLGCDVTMYEIWAWGNQEPMAIHQMEKITRSPTKGFGGSYRILHTALPHMEESDRNRDVVFCISTLEHIQDYEAAFRDLCRCVGTCGMLFLTTDFAEDERDHYLAANVRAGRMYNVDVYTRLLTWGMEEGLVPMGGIVDWAWSEPCRMVNDYGFASLSMYRKPSVLVAG